MMDDFPGRPRYGSSSDAGRAAPIARFLAIMGFLLVTGCTSHATQAWIGAGDEIPRIFFVVKHGWHAGLVVKRSDLAGQVPALGSDFPGARYLEIGWGDARYYQTTDPSMALALRAALWPTDSVLHVVGFSGAPAHVFPASEVVPVCVGAAAHNRLLNFIAETFERRPDGTIDGLGKGLYGTSRFYSARGTFHALNNCNTWAAEAIAASGLPVSGRTTFTAGGVVSRLRRDGQAAYPCP